MADDVMAGVRMYGQCSALERKAKPLESFAIHAVVINYNAICCDCIKKTDINIFLNVFLCLNVNICMQ